MATTEQKSAFERLADIWKQWGMGQSLKVEDAKTQKAALGGLIAALEAGDASLAVRSVQALLVDPERPDASGRPLFEPLWRAVRDHWDVAGTGNPADVLRLQALLLAAWEEQPENVAYEVIPALVSPWRHLSGRKAQQSTLEKWLADCQHDEQSEYAEAESVDRRALLTELTTLTKQRIYTGEADQHNVTTATNPPTVAAVPGAAFAVRTQSQVHALGKVMIQLLTSLDTEVQGRRRSYNTQELLWWGQALYCYSLRRPFRRIEGPDEAAWYAALEAANRASDLPVEPAASYLQEVLRTAGVAIDEKRSVWQHTCALRDVLRRTQAKRDEVPGEFRALVREDAFGLPVSLLCVEPGVDDEKLRDNLGVEADTTIDRGEWAAWVFRELVLQKRWLEPEPTP